MGATAGRGATTGLCGCWTGDSVGSGSGETVMVGVVGVPGTTGDCEPTTGDCGRTAASDWGRLPDGVAGRYSRLT